MTKQPQKWKSRRSSAPPSSRRGSGPKKSASRRARRKPRTVESLEDRRVLAAPTLGELSAVTVAKGAPLHLALNGADADGDALTFTATADAASSAAGLITFITGSDQAEPNPSLRLTVVERAGQTNLDGQILRTFGDMVFQLFQGRVPDTVGKIVGFATPADQDTPAIWEGSLFHRVDENFVIQGGGINGDGTSISAASFSDEFNLDIQHTSSGILSMANAGPDTNRTGVFVTARPTRNLDFNHTIVGLLTSGEDVRQEIAMVPVVNDPTNPNNRPPLDDVVIQSVEIFIDQQNGVLMVNVPNDYDGPPTATIFVMVDDGNGGMATREFTVNIEEDNGISANGEPFVEPIDDLVTTVMIPISVDLQGFDAESDPVVFLTTATPEFTIELDGVEGTASDQLTPDIVSRAATTTLKLTPKVGAVGVISFGYGISPVAANPTDTEFISVLVHPDAPTAVTLVSDTGLNPDDGITLHNNNGAGPLEFTVDGVFEGATVKLFAGTDLIGEIVVDRPDVSVPRVLTSVTFSTDGGFALPDGMNSITATQSVDGLESFTAAEITIDVDTTPPMFTSSAPVSAVVKAGDEFTFDAETDEETAGLDRLYELLIDPESPTAPLGAAIDPQSGVVTWTPTAENAGTKMIDIQITDLAGNSTIQSFDVFVLAPPNGIDLLSESDTGLDNNDDVTNLTNVPGEELKFEVSGVHPGATVSLFADDMATGAIKIGEIQVPGDGANLTSVVVTTNGTAPLGLGAYRISASQNVGSMESDLFDPDFLILIDILDPVFTSSAPVDTVLILGEDFTYDAQSDDEERQEGNQGEYALVIDQNSSTTPVGAEIDPLTGVVTWTPTVNDAGTKTFDIQMTDKAGNTTIQSFDVFVLVPPDHIVLRNDTGLDANDNVTNRNNAADNLLFFEVFGIQPGATVSLFAGAVKIGEMLVPGSGNDLTSIEILTDGAGPLADGSHAITASQSFNATQSDLSSPALDIEIDTVGPVFTSTAPADAVVLVDGLLRYDAQTDEESAGLNPQYELAIDSISPPVSPDAKFVPQLGILAWKPALDEAGTRSVDIIATDLAGNSTTQSFDVFVNDPPKFGPIVEQFVQEGDTLEVPVTVSDANAEAGDESLTFELIEGPPTASFDPNTLLFTWTPTGADQPGRNMVRIQVTDEHGEMDVAEFFATVNIAPVMDEISDVEVNEGEPVSFTVSVEDLDELTFSLEGAPAAATITKNPDGKTAEFSWTPTEADGPGAFPITVRATDGGGLDDFQEFTITVLEVAEPPVLAEIGERLVNLGSTLEFTAIATDADLPAQTLNFRFGGDAPAGATIDAMSGAFSWTPTEDQAGKIFSVTIEAVDETDLVDSETIGITVNAPPEFDDASFDQTIFEGDTLDVLPMATDVIPAPAGIEEDGPGGASLVYGLAAGAPGGAEIDPATGRLTWNTTEADGPGIYDFTVHVTDPGGLGATKGFQVTVLEVNEAPVIDPIPPREAHGGDVVVIDPVGHDADLPVNMLRYELSESDVAGATVDPVTGRFRWNVPADQQPRRYEFTIRVIDDGEGIPNGGGANGNDALLAEGLSTTRTFTVDILARSVPMTGPSSRFPTDFVPFFFADSGRNATNSNSSDPFGTSTGATFDTSQTSGGTGQGDFSGNNSENSDNTGGAPNFSTTVETGVPQIGNLPPSMQQDEETIRGQDEGDGDPNPTNNNPPATGQNDEPTGDGAGGTNSNDDDNAGATQDEDAIQDAAISALDMRRSDVVFHYLAEGPSDELSIDELRLHSLPTVGKAGAIGDRLTAGAAHVPAPETQGEAGEIGEGPTVGVSDVPAPETQEDVSQAKVAGEPVEDEVVTSSNEPQATPLTEAVAITAALSMPLLVSDLPRGSQRKRRRWVRT